MKEGREPKTEVPLIKGIPAIDIIKRLAEGCDYQQICDRYPSLDWPAINEAVHFRNRVIVPARLASGKTPKAIAEEFGFSCQNVHAIQCAIARDKELQEHWGGLPAKVVSIIKKVFHCRNLAELREKSLTEEELLSRKGVGWLTLEELKKVLPIKESPRKTTGPIYVTKAAHFQRLTDIPPISQRTQETTQFFLAVMNVADRLPLDEEASVQVPCMAGLRRKWCLGIILACRREYPAEIHWRCPQCGQSGVIQTGGTLH